MARKTTSSCINCGTGNCPIALYCSTESQQFIDQHRIIVQYKKGQFLAREDTPAYGIQILRKGRALIHATLGGDKRFIIRLASEGDILEYTQQGNSLFYPFSVEAIEDCSVCIIPKQQIFQLLRDDNNLTYHLEKSYAQKYIEVEQQLKQCMVMNIEAKVANALLVVSDMFEGRIPLLRKELGEMIGISAEQVSREITKLAKKGILTVEAKSNYILIQDREGLAQLLLDQG